MSFYTLSDKGKVRTNNEDYAESFSLSISKADGKTSTTTALILADGMGGAAGGEFASQMAVCKIKSSIIDYLCLENQQISHEQLLLNAISNANKDIYTKANDNSELKGMGTTIVVALISNNSLTLAHVGDSRCYRFTDNGFCQITKDHSLVQSMIDLGTITEAEAFVHPKRNVITRALGVDAEVEIDCKSYYIQSNELLLLCSDGLCGFVENNEIEEIVKHSYENKPVNLANLAAELIEITYKNGAGDNVSLCLYQHEKS